MKMDRHRLLGWSRWYMRLQIFNIPLNRHSLGLKNSAEYLGIPLSFKAGIIMSWLILKRETGLCSFRNCIWAQLIMTVKQLPLGITADVPDCRCHHCPCVADASTSVLGLHFIVTHNSCSSVSCLKANICQYLIPVHAYSITEYSMVKINHWTVNWVLAL